MDYNLLEKPWIPVLWNDGHSSRVGVIEALTQAAQIRQIALASPLDLFAVHRFILTLLYWKAFLAGGIEQARNSLLEDGKIPDTVVDGISKEAHRFDLFDDKMPFMQDPSTRGEKEKKSAGSFFAELAAGTNIAHFHHGDDENLRLCLPCAALGILRVVPWSQSGGAGLTPSVHNAPPIMLLAAGDNLAVTLGLNLLPQHTSAGEAKWTGHFIPSDSASRIAYLAALTWNPRRVLLPTPDMGACWYCGQKGVLTVGPGMVYLKNPDTKANKKNGKGVPFVWRDPSAFYREDDYKTVKSVSEDRAIDNRDLAWLAEAKASVAISNQDHRGWLLVVPCTNPANNKTFDHRLIELAGVSSEAISGLLPAGQPPSSARGLDGWNLPKPRPPAGIRLFVQSAIELLTHADWAALSNAAYRDMHDSPGAFDVFAGLYWGLRDKKVGTLPSRNVAWLLLKLMAAVPSAARVLHPGARFSPLHAPDGLPKRQLDARGRTSLYPVSFPRGDRLETGLRGVLESNLRKKKPEPVDWIELCFGLDQLLD
ncbi:MAG TPA: type I-E CRISPR-associated protein Cse1/CasA [Terriglobia bacterium]|nr:type I-E CRISPR-associated protein Cse1/CasA [Terriglobia bacterium]